jgi:hypothetical protein
MAALVAVVRHRRRSARRRSPSPADQVVGAWRQCLVELRGAGVRFPAANTATDCVHQIDPDLARHLTPVATLANQALFGASITPEDATDAWHSTYRLTTAVAHRRSLPRRLTHALDPLT